MEWRITGIEFGIQENHAVDFDDVDAALTWAMQGDNREVWRSNGEVEEVVTMTSAGIEYHQPFDFEDEDEWASIDEYAQFDQP